MASEPFEFRDVVLALLENALDEAQVGQCTAIAAEIFDDAVRVSDNGRGLPVHHHPRSGRPLVEVILTGPRRGPKNTLARVNAHCVWVEVEVHRNGELWFQRYEFARPATALHKRGSAIRRGTTITAAPAMGDPPSFEELCELVRSLTLESSEGAKIKVRVRDNRVARDETIVIA